MKKTSDHIAVFSVRPICPFKKEKLFAVLSLEFWGVVVVVVCVFFPFFRFLSQNRIHVCHFGFRIKPFNLNAYLSASQGT